MAWYNNHLRETNMSYWQHFLFASKMTLWVGWVFFTSAVHTILPFAFPFWAERNVIKMVKKIEERQGER